jgi:hypothetical protein
LSYAAERGESLQISDQIEALGLADELAVRPAAVIELSNAPATVARPARRRRYSKKYPVLLATSGLSGRTLLAWCPPDRKFHTHGRHGACPPGSCGCGLHADLHGFRGPCTCPVGAGDGHRSAHCIDGPFKSTGYVVREMRLADLLWPGWPRPPVTAETPPPALLAAECAGAGLSTTAARRLWALALEGAERVSQEARP